MNIEDTMQFIMESQSRAEARANRADARMDRAEARMDRAEARMDRAEARSSAMEKRFDKRIDSIASLVKQGMKMLVVIEGRVDEVAIVQKELATSQKETDRELKALIKSLRNGRNGRNGH